jgi:hypothetical protein
MPTITYDELLNPDPVSDALAKDIEEEMSAELVAMIIRCMREEDEAYSRGFPFVTQP